MVKTIEDINGKIKDGTASVLTAPEFKRLVRDGEAISPGDVDVVTCGTCGVMSGTMAALCIPVTGPGEFLRADSVTLNGVPAFPGPCPNESLGIVDLVVFGTSAASPSYGGGRLFRDIVAGEEIEVVVTACEKEFESIVYGDEIPHARMITSRSASRNYSAFVNKESAPVKTIFSVLPLQGGFSEATFSGCGEINPLENDPMMRFVRTGAGVLLNGSAGLILGTGTRSTPEAPNISAAADMKEMMPGFMGGFRTSAGPECVTTIAAAVPVVDEESVRCLSVLDEDIPLPVRNVTDRSILCVSDYGKVWGGSAGVVSANPANCLFCGECPAAAACPSGAVMPGGGMVTSRCLNCGTCLATCPGEVYSMEMGSISLEEHKIPIVLRQSDRSRGERICEELKKRIEDGEFFICVS